MSKRYKNIPTVKSPKGKVYKPNAVYPEIPETEEDIYVITVGGDRYDLLAQQFYNNSNLWWIIVTANNTFTGSLNIKPGTQIRIPASPGQAIEHFETVNRIR